MDKNLGNGNEKQESTKITAKEITVKVWNGFKKILPVIFGIAIGYAGCEMNHRSKEEGYVLTTGETEDTLAN